MYTVYFYHIHAPFLPDLHPTPHSPPLPTLCPFMLVWSYNLSSQGVGWTTGTWLTYQWSCRLNNRLFSLQKSSAAIAPHLWTGLLSLPYLHTGMWLVWCCTHLRQAATAALCLWGQRSCCVKKMLLCFNSPWPLALKNSSTMVPEPQGRESDIHLWLSTPESRVLCPVTSRELLW